MSLDMLAILVTRTHTVTRTAHKQVRVCNPLSEYIKDHQKHYTPEYNNNTDQYNTMTALRNLIPYETIFTFYLNLLNSDIITLEFCSVQQFVSS